jgi:hypothetical protein
MNKQSRKIGRKGTGALRKRSLVIMGTGTSGLFIL